MLKIKAALQTYRIEILIVIVVECSWLHPQCQIFGNVEVGKLCIYICVDYGQYIYSDETEYT